MSADNKKIDFLIIGQGLAGSLLAWKLIEEGRSVLVVDPCLEQTCSRTAAGMINPVTGKRLVKTEGIEDYFPVAISLFNELSEFFGGLFFHPMSMLRIFKSDDEKEQWKKRVSQADYDDYIGKRVNLSDKLGSDFKALQGFEQKQCGYLDTVLLLDSLRQYFKQRACFVNASIDNAELELSDAGVSWQGYKADTLVFCNGYELQNNHWFNWLPMQAVQGEIFTLETNELMPDQIVQFGKWLLPLGNNKFKLGSTWQWEPLDMKANPLNETELLGACADYFPSIQAANVVEKKVGIRPGTKDRKPFLGRHPHHPQLAVFNGFGSKGSLMIPWYSERFSQYLIGKGEIPPASDISRYADICPAG